LREVEAEAVALLCCESLGLEGATIAEVQLQNWLCFAKALSAMRLIS
jgi:hypothetical protein